MSPFRPRLVTDALRHRPEPIRVGCEHPRAVDITNFFDHTPAGRPYATSLCNACGATWCTIR